MIWVDEPIRISTERHIPPHHDPVGSAKTFVLHRVIILLLFAHIYFGLRPNAAKANPLDTYGLSSRQIAVGGAATAGADDYSATYYNPGKLPFVANGFGVGLLFSFDDVAIRLKSRPDGVDVPTLMYDSLPMDESAVSHSIRPLATEDLVNPRRNTYEIPNTIALQGGLVHDLGLSWFKLGLSVHMPLNEMARARFYYPDEREQYFSNRLHFSLIGDRSQRPSINAAMGFKPLKWLGIGIGLDMQATIAAKARMFVPDPLDQANVNLTIDGAVKYSFIPVAGVYFQPLDELGIGISYREPSWYGTSLHNEIQFWSFEVYKGEPVTHQEFNYAFSYAPREVRGGVSYNVSAWTFLADLSWRQWSLFKDMLAASSRKRFKDVWTPRLGMRVQVHEIVELSAGAAYEPSPVPRQNGRTNYVDNDRIQCSAGTEIDIPPVKGLAVGVHFQAIPLLPRSESKNLFAPSGVIEDTMGLIDEFPDSRDNKTDEYIEQSAGLQTNNPGYPGYSSEGWFGSVGVYMNYTF